MNCSRFLDALLRRPEDALFIFFEEGRFVYPRRSAANSLLDQMGRKRALYETDLLPVLREMTAGRRGIALDVAVTSGNQLLCFAGVMVLPTLSFELKRAAALNSLDDSISIQPDECGHRNGQIWRHLAILGNRGSDTTSEGGREAKRELVRLDDVPPSLPPEAQQVVLKVDVEGNEEAVLRGAAETIERHGRVVSAVASGVDAFDASRAILAELSSVAVDVQCAPPIVFFPKTPGGMAAADIRVMIAAHHRSHSAP